jgi:hypothetical protein
MLYAAVNVHGREKSDDRGQAHESAILFLFLLLFAPQSASAQFSSAIQGIVTDSQGGVLPGATVTVTNTTTGMVRDVVTSGDGAYRVFSIGAGTYRIDVDLSGCRKAQREAVNVGISETKRIDFTLEVLGSPKT